MRTIKCFFGFHPMLCRFDWSSQTSLNEMWRIKFCPFCGRTRAVPESKNV